MQVLWLLKGLGPGGAERVVLLSARRRRRGEVEGVVAHLLPHKDHLVGAVEAEGVAVRCLGGRRGLDPRWLWRLRALMVASGTDVVHAHAPVPAVGARLVARTIRRSARPKLVVTYHSLWSSRARLTNLADAATARLDDARFAVSEAVRRSLPTSIGRACEVVLHGVDADEVAAAAVGAREQVRAELGIDPDEVVVVTAANLRAPKAYPDLLAAAVRATEREPRLRFITLGQGPLAEEIAARHRASGLGERFLLLGYRDDAVRVAAAADLACLPSVAEGFPLALVEAAVLGLPAVATAVGGIPEVVVDGVTGVLVAPGAPEALADALVALASDPARRAVLGAAAAARGREISIEAAVARYEARYRELVA
ncbi:MAG: glycosyltransferase [Acidimicrobiales bacterium]